MWRADSLENREGLGAGGEGDDREWDGWMVSPTRWTWVWVNSGSWWWTGRPGVLRFMGSKRVGHDWVTEVTDWLIQVTELVVVGALILNLCWLESPHSWQPHWTPNSKLLNSKQLCNILSVRWGKKTKNWPLNLAVCTYQHRQFCWSCGRESLKAAHSHTALSSSSLVVQWWGLSWQWTRLFYPLALNTWFVAIKLIQPSFCFDYQRMLASRYNFED